MLANWSKVLSHLLSTDVQVTGATTMGGGCISEVFWLKTVAKGSLVVKRNQDSMVSNFRCEAAGLRALGETNVIRAPVARAVDTYQSHAFLVMDHVSPAQSPGERDLQQSFAAFGRQLAELHRQTSGAEIGWKGDNFLGSAKQVNQPTSTWNEFAAQHRLGFQLRWLVDQGLADGKLQSDVERIIQRLDDLLSGRLDETSLLHGDLWSGNYLFDINGEPVLIDPAVYRGCREAEWGMLNWFGGCSPEFEEAYMSEWPMPDGWRRRAKVYTLYHQLNHLNLFGGGYRSSCQHLARQILCS